MIEKHPNKRSVLMKLGSLKTAIKANKVLNEKDFDALDIILDDAFVYVIATREEDTIEPQQETITQPEISTNLNTTNNTN
jgi:hypothetical protein